MADRIAAYALAKKFKEATPEEAQILYNAKFRKGNHVTMDFDVLQMRITEYLQEIRLKRHNNDHLLESYGGFEVYDDSIERAAMRATRNVVTAKDLRTSIKDELPNEDEQCLVWFDNHSPTTVSILEYIDGSFYDYKQNRTYTRATHWMSIEKLNKIMGVGGD